MNLEPSAPWSGIYGQCHPLIEHYGYLIVFFGVMLGTAGIRFPSAAILLTAGMLVQQGQLGLGAPQRPASKEPSSSIRSATGSATGRGERARPEVGQ
jgi:hypothetical protein